MTLRLRKISDLNRKRTLKALYTHTQAYPYAATLDAGFDRTAGQLAGTYAVTGSSAAILPGSCMVKTVGENVTLANQTELGGAPDKERIFGLAAHFVGGDLDELGDGTSISVWRGTGSTFLLRAPAFNDTGLSAAADAETGADNVEVYLKNGTDGRLVLRATGDGGYAENTDVARLIKRHSSTAIEIELLV